MQQFENSEIVASGSHPGFDYVTVRHAADVVHRVTVTGPFDLRRRITMYEETLKATPSSRYICILDNHAEYENKFAYDDMVLIANLLVREGIKTVYGVTITGDEGYPKLVQIVTAILQVVGLDGAVITTSDPEVADAFIRERLVQHAATDGAGR